MSKLHELHESLRAFNALGAAPLETLQGKPVAPPLVTQTGEQLTPALRKR